MNKYGPYSNSLRALSLKEIRKLSSESGVRSVAVENFLLMIRGTSVEESLERLEMEAKLYNWNPKTISQIRKGIYLASHPEMK